MKKYLKINISALIMMTVLGILIANSFYNRSVKGIMFVLCGISILAINVSKRKMRMAMISVCAILIFNLFVSIPCYRYMYVYGVTFNQKVHFLTNSTCYVWNTNYSDSIIPLLVNKKTVYIAPCAEEYYKYFEHFSAKTEMLSSDVQPDYELIRGESIDIGRIVAAPDYLFSQTFISAVGGQEVQPHLYVHSSSVARTDSIVVFLDNNLNLYILDIEEWSGAVPANS